jgi:Lrp/AsnC family transcriptional regulator for asnA, asnC and gidA
MAQRKAIRGGVDFDGLDEQIVGALKENGRASNQKIAEQLGLSAAAVGALIKRMERDRILQLVLVSDFTVAGCGLMLAVGIHVVRRSARLVALELAKLPQVFSCSVMIGKYNVEALVGLSGVEELKRFIEVDLATIEGIGEVSVDIAADMLKYEFDVVPFLPEGERRPFIALDEIDRVIVERLSEDARLGYRVIAESLDVTEGTIRARLKRLKEADLIRFTALTNATSVGMMRVVFIRVQTEFSSIRSVAEAIASLPEARAVIVTAGAHNILTIGQLDNPDDETSSLIAQIYALKGVLSIETSIIMESVKYNYRLAKIISPPTE